MSHSSRRHGFSSHHSPVVLHGPVAFTIFPWMRCWFAGCLALIDAGVSDRVRTVAGSAGRYKQRLKLGLEFATPAGDRPFSRALFGNDFLTTWNLVVVTPSGRCVFRLAGQPT